MKKKIKLERLLIWQENMELIIGIYCTIQKVGKIVNIYI